MDGHRPAFDLGQKSQCSMLVVYHNAVFRAHFAVRARLDRSMRASAKRISVSLAGSATFSILNSPMKSTPKRPLVAWRREALRSSGILRRSPGFAPAPSLRSRNSISWGSKNKEGH